MGNSTARFFEPYHDPGNCGRWRPLMVAGTLKNHFLDADRAGLQVSIHAIGDEANSVLLDYLDELTRTNGARDRRFRLVHAQVVRPSDLPRMKGVVAVLSKNLLEIPAAEILSTRVLYTIVGGNVFDVGGR